jgi:flagellar biosynthesis regulator FlbT
MHLCFVECYMLLNPVTLDTRGTQVFVAFVSVMLNVFIDVEILTAEHFQLCLKIFLQILKKVLT